MKSPNLSVAIWFFVSVALALSVVGCSKPVPVPTPSRAKPVKVTPVVAGPPITQKEVDAFAKSLEQAANQGEYVTLNRLIDLNSVIDSVTAQPDSPALDAGRRGFKNGITTQLQQGSNSLFADVVNAVRGGGSIKMLRCDLQRNPPEALFRLRLGVGKGLNYLRLSLGRNAQGQVIATDLYNFVSGERISDSLQRAWGILVRETERSGVAKLVLPKNSLFEHADDLKRIGELVRSQKFAEGMALIHKLPPDLQKEKNVLSMRLLAAQNISEEEYIQVIDDWRKFHPQDSSLDFIGIDGNLLRKRYDESLKCIRSLRRSVGDDAALDVLEGNVLVLAKRYDEARKMLDSALKAEPGLPDAYFFGISLSLIEKKFGETVRHLDGLRDKCGLEIPEDALQADADYAELLKSPEYKKWRSAQPAADLKK